MDNIRENTPPSQAALEPYRRLRDRVDAQAAALLKTHAAHIVCRPGCRACCTNLTVFPVEYESILDELRRAGVASPPFDQEEECGFLNQDGLCAFYPSRPLICRTHGLPVVFLNEDADPPEHNVSFCPENFADADEDALEFGPDNTLELDELNAELAALNNRFIQDNPGLGYRLGERVPLRRLTEDLRRLTKGFRAG